MNTNKAKMMIKHEISTPIFGVLKKTTCEFVKKNKYKKSIKRKVFNSLSTIFEKFFRRSNHVQHGQYDEAGSNDARASSEGTRRNR